MVSSKNGTRRPRKSGLSSLFDCLLCLPLCCACCLNLAGRLLCWERASHSVLPVCYRKNVVILHVYVFSFQPGVYGGTLKALIASILGPAFLTLHQENMSM